MQQPWHIMQISEGYSSRLRPRGMTQANSQAPSTWGFDWVQELYARWLEEQSSEVTGGPWQVAGSHFCRRVWGDRGRQLSSRTARLTTLWSLITRTSLLTPPLHSSHPFSH